MSARLCVVFAWILICVGPSAADEPAPPLPETRVVLRISRTFIRELTAKEFQRDVPVEMDEAGTAINGTAHADGVTDVQIQANDNACSFDLVVNGRVSTRLTATTRAVQIRLQGSAPFEARRRIAFDDVAFSARPVQVTTSYQSSVEGICSFRPGLIGAFARGIASAKVRNDLGEYDMEAGAEVRKRLTAAIQSENDEMLTTLNKIGALVKQGEQLLRDEKLLSSRTVQHYVAATEKNLYISLGPPNHRIARLPRLLPSEREPIELWVGIRKAGKPDRFSPIIANWRFVKPFMLPRIAKQSPETAKILDQVQVRQVGDWHVLTFAPDLLKSLELTAN